MSCCSPMCEFLTIQTTVNIWNKYPLTNHMLQETRCFDALAELYSLLNEEDVLFGLWKKRCSTEETRAALACIQHGFWEPAQDALLEAMRKQATGAYPAGHALFNFIVSPA